MTLAFILYKYFPSAACSVTSCASPWNASGAGTTSASIR